MRGLQFYYIGFDSNVNRWTINHTADIHFPFFDVSAMDTSTLHLVHALLLLWLLTVAALVAERIFMAAAVYHGCKANAVKNAVVWTAATAVFGWIPAAIYSFACRTVYAKRTVCAACGQTVTAALPCAQVPHNRLLIGLGAAAAIIAFIVYNYVAFYTFGLFDLQSIPAWIQNFPF